jgi:hypothetical protein
MAKTASGQNWAQPSTKALTMPVCVERKKFVRKNNQKGQATQHLEYNISWRRIFCEHLEYYILEKDFL